MTTRPRTLALAAVACWLASAGVTRADPLLQQIVVANRGGGTISVLDVATNAVATHALPAAGLAPEPMYVVYSPTNDRVFVGDRRNNRVVAFDARTFAVLNANIPVGNGAFHMWGDPLLNQLWVNNDIDKTISVIDMTTFATVATIPTPNDLGPAAVPHDVILDPTAPFAYVTVLNAAADDFVVKYSQSTFAEVDRQAVGQDPHVVLTRHNGNLYVASQNSDDLSILDRDTLSPLGSLTIDNAHGVTVTADGGLLYVTSFPGTGVNGLTVIDTLTNGILGSVTTPMLGAGPHNLALSSDNTRLYITHTGPTSTSVSVFDIAGANRTSPVHLTDVTVGLNPFGIAAIPAAVPEPATVALLLTGASTLTGVSWFRRRSRRRG
jgi:DNA-binding beta-propeller fold protein YncE